MVVQDGKAGGPGGAILSHFCMLCSRISEIIRKFALMKQLMPILIVIALCCCGRASDSGKPLLAVSIEPQRAMLEELAGDRFDVVSILANGANPESYDPTIAQRRQVEDAAAYFAVGHLPFEDNLSKSLSSTRMVDTSKGIALLYDTHAHAQGHAADPHVWTSYRNAKVMAANMLAELVDIDPGHADEYHDRYSRLAARLDSLDADACARFDSHPAFAVWHPSLSYFAHDYGLHQIAVGQESKEASPSSLRAAIDEARADSVRVFFYQKEYDSRQAQNISDAIGSRLVTFNPLAYDWEQELTSIVNVLAD